MKSVVTTLPELRRLVISCELQFALPQFLDPPQTGRATGLLCSAPGVVARADAFRRRSDTTVARRKINFSFSVRLIGEWRQYVKMCPEFVGPFEVIEVPQRRESCHTSSVQVVYMSALRLIA